jgi:hypothetical protein
MAYDSQRAEASHVALESMERSGVIGRALPPAELSLYRPSTTASWAAHLGEVQACEAQRRAAVGVDDPALAPRTAAVVPRSNPQYVNG